MLLPLITIPILSRRLTQADFGSVLYAQTVSFLFAIILDFGFIYTATRKISISRDDKILVSENVALIQTAKIILVILFLISSYIFLHYFAPKDIDNVIIVVFLCNIAILNFAPNWYFQAVEKMYQFAILELLSRLIVVALTFFLLPSLNGGVFYAWLNSGTSLLLAVMTSLLMYKNLIYKKPSLSNAFRMIKHSFPMFLMRVGSSFYVFLPSIIIGNSFGSQQVALYGGADRIFRAITALISPVSDAIFPRVNAAASTDRELHAIWLKRSFFILMLISLILFIALEVSAPFIINYLLGENYEESTKLLRILGISIPAIGLGTFFGLHYLVSHNKDKIFTTVVIVSGLIVLALILSNTQITLEKIAFSVVLAEWLVVLGCGTYIVLWNRRAELDVFKGYKNEK